jgi:hypothetical protein
MSHLSPLGKVCSDTGLGCSRPLLPAAAEPSVTLGSSLSTEIYRKALVQKTRWQVLSR